ncbi:oligopeptide ABC transporter permease [Neobacillus niacini]|uniref:oligopeptide ABC transporter permease n=1 Tax=Neobacillus niacini TaxID=86668 RepID=UPI000693B6CD|nr:oligopeptide ABC transporter permease [Neobacillus niacini]
MNVSNLQPNSEINAKILISEANEHKDESYVKMVLRRFLKHRLAVVSAVGLVLISLVALFAPFLAPYDPYAVTGAFGAGPSAQHFLGTDLVSRDALSRLIYAARVSLQVGVGAVAISSVIGTILGLISGYAGGKVDTVIMRIVDVFMSFPHLMLILVVVSIVGSSLTNLILILGLLNWTGMARIVRGSVLSIKQLDYVKASIALGFSTPRILFKHILPNVLAPILVHATFGIANAIMVEAALSFLGLGVQPPTASWGNMLTEAQSMTVLTSQPWLWVPAGVMIVLTVLAVNFIGDGLRDALDPKSIK